MTHLIIIAERPDACSPAAVQSWSAFLSKSKEIAGRDRNSKTLLPGCFLLGTRESGSTIADILDCAREAGIRYQVCEALSCTVASKETIQHYDPSYSPE